MPVTASTSARAVLAVTLLVGFYLLAFSLIGVLLYLPYAELAYLHRLDIKLALFSLVGAGTIGWAILPRVDKFEPPGPLLRPEVQPELFQKLREVAQATGQPMPAEVFLVSDVNAWVAQRGGVMGFGSRPVMGLGLPLLQVLSVSQLEAVIAHEFGHFHGGDTRLGPWVYKTRVAIGRTLAGLEGQSSALQKPFEWYAALFLRLSQSVSRQQELAADALAARVVGACALSEGLRRVHGAALAYSAFWQNELAPLLGAGLRPPIASGFARFAAVPKIAEVMERSAQEAATSGQSDPYDTHPSLREREAALATAVATQRPNDDRAALALLNGVDELELALLAAIADPSQVQNLRKIEWHEATESHWLPLWERVARDHASLLADLRADALPDVVNDLGALEERLPEEARAELPPEERERMIHFVFGAALTVALARSGWIIQSDPGEQVEVTHDGRKLEPFAVSARLASGDMSRESWSELCAATGIRELPLAAPAAPPS